VQLRSLFLMSSMVLACCLGGSYAHATTILITYTGTISDGFDQTGVFGPAGTSLSGDTYSLVYTFDTAGAILDLSGLPFSSRVYGGPDTNVPSSNSPGKASLTINGKTALFTGNFKSSDLNRQGFTDPVHFTCPCQSSTEQLVQNTSTPSMFDDSFVMSDVTVPDLSIPGSIFVPFSVAASDISQYDMLFSIDSHTIAEDPMASGSLIPLSLTVSAVPIPAALPLFVGGLAGLGVIARVRRRFRLV
jgi:hypothetical protein